MVFTLTPPKHVPAQVAAREVEDVPDYVMPTGQDKKKVKLPDNAVVHADHIAIPVCIFLKRTFNP